MELLSAHVVASAVPSTANIVVARTRANAFDYHGLALLSKYRDHPLIAANELARDLMALVRQRNVDLHH